MGTADPYVVAQALTLIALMAWTVEYCEILLRRTAARRRKIEEAVQAEAGLRGLIRVFLMDR